MVFTMVEKVKKVHNLVQKLQYFILFNFMVKELVKTVHKFLARLCTFFHRVTLMSTKIHATE